MSHSGRGGSAARTRPFSARSPVEAAHDYIPGRRRIDAGLYGHSAFLTREDPDGKPARGLTFFLVRRPEQLSWEPLLVLALWQHEVLRLDARYHVEPGRRVDTNWSEPSLDVRIHDSDEGWVEEEWHRPGGWTLRPGDTDAFGRFADAVHGMLAGVLGRQSGKQQKKTARRARRAGQHLVRAAQRSFPGGTVDEEDRDEVVLHYVIAIEALLADEDNLDLSRKVAYRGAALHLTDAERVRVRELLAKAYTARSKYAHGDETNETDIDLRALRQAAVTIYLRWLVVHTRNAWGNVPALLDRSVLDHDAHARTLHDPLTAFHTATPPAQPPSDIPPHDSPRRDGLG